MNVTNGRLKDRQLHNEGYLQMVSAVFLLSRPVSKQLLDIVREQVLLISCFAADSPLKYQ